MNVRFPAYQSREAVVAMLEEAVRSLSGDLRRTLVHPATDDIEAILDELDRMDRVSKAKRQLALNRDEWNRAAVAAGVKVVDAPAGAECTEKNYARDTWQHGDRGGQTHKARWMLNGVPYCGTHIQRARERAKWDAIHGAEKGYVEDASLRAIVDADQDLLRARRVKP